MATKRQERAYVLPRLGATGGLIRNSEEVAFGGADFQRIILLLLRTASNYIQAVGGEELVRVEEQTSALARDRLRDARNFFEAGAAASPTPSSPRRWTVSWPRAARTWARG